MTQKIPAHARKRLRVGRTQKFSASAYRLRNVLQWENYIWIYMLLSFFISQIFLSGVLVKLSQDMGNIGLLAINTSIAIIVYSALSGRVVYNIIIRQLLKYGMDRDKHILNIIVSAINTIVVIPLFFAAAYATVFSNVVLFNIREPLWNLVKELVLPQGEANPLLLLAIAVLAGMYLTLSLLTIFLFFNSVRSIVNLINTFILLPSQSIISENLRIKNYHHSDNGVLEKIYLDSLNREYPQATFTQKDYEKFLSSADPRYIRVFLEQGEPVGFYLTSQKRSAIETMMVDQAHKGKNLHIEFLKDFERIAYRKFIRTIKANLPQKDSKTIQFLIERGWNEEESTVNGQVKMVKRISKNS